MDERQKALHRLTDVCRQTPDATPYLIGYLAFRNETAVLEKAIDSWFEHDETIETMRIAEKLAQEQARLHPKM